VAALITNGVSTPGVQASSTRVSTSKQSSTAVGIFAPKPTTGIDRVALSSESLGSKKAARQPLSAQILGSGSQPLSRFSPKASTDYRNLGKALQMAAPAGAPPAVPELASAVVPKKLPKAGPLPSSKPQAEALRAFRPDNPADTRAIFNDPAATIHKLKPISNALKVKVGSLSAGQGRALVDSLGKTAVAQTAVVRRDMEATKRQNDLGRRKLAAQIETTRDQSIKAARRLKVKFDSVPEHLREFAEKAGRKVVVPLGEEKSQLDKMLEPGRGMVGFTGPGMAAYNAFTASG
jgi:hypothetical protein